MRFAPIFDPDARRPSPKPVQVDLRKVFLIGTLLWCAATLVILVLATLGFPVRRPLTICVCGTIIGVLMLIWEHFDRWDYRRLGR